MGREICPLCFAWNGIQTIVLSSSPSAPLLPSPLYGVLSLLVLPVLDTFLTGDGIVTNCFSINLVFSLLTMWLGTPVQASIFKLCALITGPPSHIPLRGECCCAGGKGNTGLPTRPSRTADVIADNILVSLPFH